MENKIIQEISKVFGVSEKDAKEFLLYSSNEQNAPKGFFTSFLKKIPKPELIERPRRPKAPEAPVLLNLSNMNSWTRQIYEERQQKIKNRYAQYLNEYTQDVKNYNRKYKNYKTATRSNKSIEVNEGVVPLNNNGNPIGYLPQGEFGFVKTNKVKPFVYKYLKLSSFTEDQLKKVFVEPLINIILQLDEKASPMICRLIEVYAYPLDEENIQLIYKLEKLDISVSDILEELQQHQEKYNKEEENIQFIYKLEKLDKSVSDITEELQPHQEKYNKDVVLHIFGPLYKLTDYLRKTYKFEHSDLHTGNLMFTKNPYISAQNTKVDVNKLEVKIIDFGFSSLTLGELSFGELYNEYSELSFFTMMSNTKGLFPPEFMEPLQKVIKSGTSQDLLEFIVYEYNNLQSAKKQGGSSRRAYQRRLTKKLKRRQ